jgi:hypothetical protein
MLVPDLTLTPDFQKPVKRREDHDGVAEVFGGNKKMDE